MASAPQKRAMENYRSRLLQRGLKRFEVLALESDQELIRSLARRLTEEGAEAEWTRTAIVALLSGGNPGKGRILAALRHSPLADADLDLSRASDDGREISF